jgi:hypothetical protein
MNLLFEPIRFVLKDIVWSIVYFPIWWYTAGALNVLKQIGTEVGGFVRAYNLRILLRFMFTPMYGQNDIAGRLISLYVRMGHFLILSVYSVLYISILLLLFAIWITLPIVILYNVLFHLSLVPGITF